MPAGSMYRYRPNRRNSRLTRKPKRKTRRAGMKRARGPMHRVAKSTALSLKETKKHIQKSTTGIENWSSSSKWEVFQPLNLDKSSVDSESQRESNWVYAMNTRFRCDIETNPVSKDPYYIRFVHGWAKGDTTYPGQKTPFETITAGNLQLTMPNYYSDWDTDDFKILSDKLVRVGPKQIYDSTSGDSTLENTGIENLNRGLWPSVRKFFNFKFNRKFHFEGTQASELVGWVPFIAMQLDRTRYGSQHTGTGGSNPSPCIAYEMTTYFKDIV